MENEGEKIPEGFVLLARKIGAEDSWVRCLRPQHFKFMVMLLLRARWKSGVYMTPTGNLLSVDRGQYAAPVRRLADECGISYQSARTGLGILARREFLTHEVTQGVTVVTILNYERYQDIKNYINAIPNELLTQSQRKGNALKKEGSKKVEKRIITPGEANKYFYEKLGGVAPDMAAVIQDFEATRKGGTMAPSLIIKTVDYWLKIGTANSLLEAKREWDEGRYAKEGKDEKYFNGILRGVIRRSKFRRRSQVGARS